MVSDAAICSTYVEMFLTVYQHCLGTGRLLHVCGDVLFHLWLWHLESDDQLHLELFDIDFEVKVEEEGLEGLVCDIDQPELL